MTSAKKRQERAARKLVQRHQRKSHGAGVARDPKAAWISEYRDATGRGAELELKLRLLADLFPELLDELKPVAHHDTGIMGIRQAIGTAFHKRGHSIPREHNTTLQGAIELRNDLMHTDFHGARALLHKAGVPPVSGGITHVPLPQGGPEMLAALESLKGATRVSEMTTSFGNTYAWLLELGQAGYFREATRVFKQAIEIVDDLALRASRLPHRLPEEADERSDPSGRGRDGRSRNRLQERS